MYLGHTPRRSTAPVRNGLPATPPPAGIRTRGGGSYSGFGLLRYILRMSTAFGAKRVCRQLRHRRLAFAPGAGAPTGGSGFSDIFCVGAPPPVRRLLCRYSVKGQAFMCSSLNNCEESKAVSSLMHAHIPVRYFLITAHWACIFFLPRYTSAS